MGTAPKTCPRCGAHLDAGEVCTCQQEEQEVLEATEGTGSMEFVMGNSLAALPKTIDFNFEQLKGQLAISLETYTGLVVTEEGIKAAKEDRAKLNKLREALETKRKEVKKECMAPYTDFENKVKELVGLIDKPIAAIDGQLQVFEEQRRQTKREAVQAIYDDTAGELRGLLSFEKVWEDSWYNVGVSLKKIREAITAKEAKVASDLEVLSTVESEFTDAVKLKYLEKMDLSAALAERARLQEQAARLREYEGQKQAQITHAAPPAPVEGTWEPGGGAAVEEPVPVPEGERVYLLRFEAKVTTGQAAELAEWLKAHNIEYRRI